MQPLPDFKPRSRLLWESTLGAMRAHGARVVLTGCRCADQAVDLDAMIARFGERGMLWDLPDYCWACRLPRHYAAALGPRAPFRPLLSRTVFDLAYETRREAFLQGFGFSRRDIARIRALAESVTAQYTPAALADLDAPYRVGACETDREGNLTGTPFGRWAGRTLLYWRFEPEEMERRGRRRVV